MSERRWGTERHERRSLPPQVAAALVPDGPNRSRRGSALDVRVLLDHAEESEGLLAAVGEADHVGHPESFAKSESRLKVLKSWIPVDLLGLQGSSVETSRSDQHRVDHRLEIVGGLRANVYQGHHDCPGFW